MSEYPNIAVQNVWIPRETYVEMMEVAYTNKAGFRVALLSFIMETARLDIPEFWIGQDTLYADPDATLPISDDAEVVAAARLYNIMTYGSERCVAA